MIVSAHRRLAAIALATLALIGIDVATAAPAASSGVTWRVTASMSMQGMNVPGQTMEVCQPVNAPTTVPSSQGDSNCSVSNHRRVGNTESFDMRCTGKERMEGRMEITHLGTDHYRGRMRATTTEGNFEMNYEGRKVGRACDAGAAQRLAQTAVTQSQAQQLAMCQNTAREGDPTYFLGDSPLCRGAAERATLCGKVKEYAGFGRLLDARRLASTNPAAATLDNSAQVANLCRFQVNAHQQQLCGRAQTTGEMEFLGRHCPSLADPIARRECVGRGFSSPVAAPYITFCTAWAEINRPAGANEDVAEGDARAPNDEPRNPIREGAREVLKGILGF